VVAQGRVKGTGDAAARRPRGRSRTCRPRRTAARRRQWVRSAEGRRGRPATRTHPRRLKGGRPATADITPPDRHARWFAYTARLRTWRTRTNLPNVVSQLVADPDPQRVRQGRSVASRGIHTRRAARAGTSFYKRRTASSRWSRPTSAACRTPLTQEVLKRIAANRHRRAITCCCRRPTRTPRRVRSGPADSTGYALLGGRPLFRPRASST